jgi:hypothetical protein
MTRLKKIIELQAAGWQTHSIGTPWIIMSIDGLDDNGNPCKDFIRVWPDGRTTHHDTE